ncbi:MAG TPA: amidohydrolase family protein [Gemmatimonadales bacterium]
MQTLRNADIYAPNHLGVRDVLVAGERIAWIGTSAPPLRETLGVAEVDLDGARLMPGLIDAHAHLTGGGGEAGATPARVPDGQQRGCIIPIGGAEERMRNPAILSRLPT